MALDLNAVMDALGVRLAMIDGLRVADYPSDAANPPQAIVSLPEQDIEYDVVGARGADRAVIPIMVLVGRVSDRAARDLIAQYVSGTGARSVKAAIEGDASVGQTARVTAGRVQVVTIQAVEYLGASFDVEVID